MLTSHHSAKEPPHMRRVFLDRLTRGNQVCRTQRKRNFAREMEITGCAGWFLGSSCSSGWLWCLPIFLILIYHWSKHSASASRSCHLGTRLPMARVPQWEEDIDFNSGTI